MAMLKGNYTKWNFMFFYPYLEEGKNEFIWDLNLSKRVYKGDRKSAEIFFTAHNIFDNDGYDYNMAYFKAPGRWMEAGLRVKF